MYLSLSSTLVAKYLLNTLVVSENFSKHRVVASYEIVIAMARLIYASDPSV